MKNILCAISVWVFVIDIKSAEIGTIKSRDSQVFEIMGLIPGKSSHLDPKTFSHGNLMNVGLVCKEWNDLLRTSAGHQKKYILKTYPLAAEERLNVWHSGDAKWHRYGSRVDYKKIVENDNSLIKKKLILGRLELGEEGMVKRYFREGSNFDSELSYKPSPFYKSDEELCCFALAFIQSRGLSFCKRLVLYSAPLTGHINPLSTNLPLECSLRYVIGNSQYHESLIKLLNFSHLLKSIVNMPYDYFWNGHEYGYRFDLEKITLPDNYKECVESNEQNCYKAFEQLPEDLKAALEKRFEEQPKPEQKTEK